MSPAQQSDGHFLDTMQLLQRDFLDLLLYKDRLMIFFFMIEFVSNIFAVYTSAKRRFLTEVS